MRRLPLRFSQYFDRQVDDIATYYLMQASERTASSFLEAVQYCLDLISENPLTGSIYQPLAPSEKLNEHALRCMHLSTRSTFPYSIFYEVSGEQVAIFVIHHQSVNHDALLGNL